MYGGMRKLDIAIAGAIAEWMEMTWNVRTYKRTYSLTRVLTDISGCDDPSFRLRNGKDNLVL